MAGNPVALLTVLLVGLTALFLMLQLRKQITMADRREYRLRSYAREQSGAIRAMAREALVLRRTLTKTSDEVERMAQDTLALREKVRQAEAVDRRLYVLDDRRSPSDHEFVAAVSHPAYQRHVQPKATDSWAAAWAAGRRYVVWAADRDRAVAKVAARLPSDHGYVVHSVMPRPVEPAGTPREKPGNGGG